MPITAFIFLTLLPDGNWRTLSRISDRFFSLQILVECPEQHAWLRFNVNKAGTKLLARIQRCQCKGLEGRAEPMPYNSDVELKCSGAQTGAWIVVRLGSL